MARARNIKPSFFSNEDLAELDPLTRLAFIGLWTLANYKGCLEYRPKRIKMQVLPYDNCDIEQIISDLERSRFIAIYNVHGQAYIKILSFEKHQNPHPNERKVLDQIPDIGEHPQKQTQAVDSNNIAINNDKSRQAIDLQQSDRAESLLLIPDSLLPAAAGERTQQLQPHPLPPERFRMTVNWVPRIDNFDLMCTQAGITIDPFTPACLNEFRLYWSGRNDQCSQSQWVGKYLKALKRHQGFALVEDFRLKRDVIRAKGNDKDAMGFIDRHTDRSWHEDLMREEAARVSHETRL